MRPRIRVLAAVVGLGMVAAACASRSGDASITVGDQKVSTRELADAAAGLCRAQEQADADLQGARATFFDRSHQALHTIARALETVDRPLAARLLEAKQSVEADFSGNASPPKLRDDLGTLADATRAGLRRLKVDVPACRT